MKLAARHWFGFANVGLHRGALFWGLFRARAANTVPPALPGKASGDLEVLLGKAACVVARQLDDDLAPTHLQVWVMALRIGYRSDFVDEVDG